MIKVKTINRNYIPDMVYPLSKGWSDQPKREDIIIDDTTARMSEKSFKMLNEYSTSQPSGVYEGKMWKAHWYEIVDGARVFDWYLCWFGLSTKPGSVSNNSRKIIIV